jgi:hypothetical protein
VFGDTRGVAPGYEGSLEWWKLEFYSEGEYVIDTGAEDSFFYNWSELTLSPLDWFGFGILAQRTRAYETEREIQRGLLARISLERLALALYVLNPDDSEATVIVGVDLGL